MHLCCFGYILAWLEIDGMQLTDSATGLYRRNLGFLELFF